jgi:hypothetical protein
MLATINKHFIPALRSKVRIIQALNDQMALQYLTDTNLKGVFVGDEGIIKSENSKVLSSLIRWVNDGGIAVTGSVFASFISWDNLDRFFEKWGLPWKMGSYLGTTFVLNSSIHQLSSQSASLMASYSMKAVHIKGVEAEDVLYAPTIDEDTDEDDIDEVSPLPRGPSRPYVFPPSTPVDLLNVPIAYTRVGNGFLGYVGDVNAEEGSTSVILAMLRL